VGLLKRLAAWYVDQGGGEGLAEVPTEGLRDSLRGLKGVGPGSVDVVLLRGLGRAAMPVERGSARVLVRHGWIDTSQSYDEIRQILEGLAPEEPSTLAALAEGLEKVASEFCKPAKPRCERCPLRPWLPEGGPVEPL
jgi:endonuclease-3 related protein